MLLIIREGLTGDNDIRVYKWRLEYSRPRNKKKHTLQRIEFLWVNIV